MSFQPRDLPKLGILLIAGACLVSAPTQGAAQQAATRRDSLSGSSAEAARLFTAAMRAINAKKSDSALTLLDSVLAIQPTHGPALFQRGMLHFNSGDTAAARLDLTQAAASGDSTAEYYLTGAGKTMWDHPPSATTAADSGASQSTPSAARASRPYVRVLILVLVLGAIRLFRNRKRAGS